jgi:DNA-binding response OmpR family regulator
MTSNKKKILLIEDEAPMLRALEDGFHREGLETISAGNGEAGLGLALKQKPDLIVLDILLPGIDGLTVMKKLRTEGGEYGKSVPVVILTNLSPDSEEINQTVAATSPTYYLVKADWTVEDVVAKVKERLTNK